MLEPEVEPSARYALVTVALVHAQSDRGRWVSAALHDLAADAATIRTVLPDASRMDGETAAALAQVVPVLMLTLLFEIRVRRSESDPRPRLRAVILGFAFNLAVAALAIAVEFGLLAVVQAGRLSDGAEFLWWGSFALFAIVMLRWVTTTALAQVVRDRSPSIRSGLAAFNGGLVAGITETLRFPAASLADAMAIFGEALIRACADVITGINRGLAEIGSAARAPGWVLRSLGSSIADSVKIITREIGALPVSVVRIMMDLFRNL